MARSMCCLHKKEKAVGSCKKCGNPICQECMDEYQENEKNYCYYCHTKMVAKEIKKAEKTAKKSERLKKRLEREKELYSTSGGRFKLFFFIYPFRYYIGSLVNLVKVIGYVAGKHLLSMGCGGGMVSLIFFTLAIILLGYTPLIALIVPLVLVPFKWLFGSLRPKVRNVEIDMEIEELEGIIENDTTILQNMRDYYEYLQTVVSMPDFDLTDLTSEGGKLFENTFAQSIIQNGSQSAHEKLREGLVEIAANGEIVRKRVIKSDNIFARSTSAAQAT